MISSRIPRRQLLDEYEKLDARLRETIATRDGRRLPSSIDRVRIERRIDLLDAELTRLHQAIHDIPNNSLPCRTERCPEYVTERERYDMCGYCHECWRAARGLAPAPEPDPHTPAPPSIGSPWGN